MILSPLALIAQAQAPVDSDALLKELDKIEVQRQDQMTNGLSSVINQLSGALGSPKDAVDLYEKAVFANRFEGQKQDEVEFNKWKQQEGEKMMEPVFLSALQFHIQYLIYTLKKVSGVENANQVNDLISYVQKYRDAEDTFSDGPKDPNKPANPRSALRDTKRYDELLQQPVGQGPFAKFFQIEKQLDDVKDWEKKPGNSRGIEDQSIFPVFRDKKDPNLLALWDKRIDYERQRAERSGLNGDQSRFENEAYPNLLWSKAKDQLVLGDQSGGIHAMMDVIHTYPTNANFKQWLDELRGILKPAPAPAAG
jgi:hypothetical protein